MVLLVVSPGTELTYRASKVYTPETHVTLLFVSVAVEPLPALRVASLEESLLTV